MSADPQSATPDFLETAAREGVLRGARCQGCGAVRVWSAPLCPGCLDTRSAPARLSGRARLYSYTEVHRAPGGAFRKEVPYLVALVDLEEGPRLMVRLVASPAALRAGTPLRFAGTGDTGLGPWLRFELAEGTE